MGGLTRRQLLRLGLLAGAGGSLLDVRRAEARLFGEAPADKVDVMLPEDRRVESVLEVFLFGGLSHYESLYCVEEFGKSDGTHFYAFPTTQIEAALADCGVTGSPSLF